MTQEQINDGNLLIARFMNLPIFPLTWSNVLIETDVNGFLQVEPAKYHIDWNWLIPACYKWDNLDLTDEIEYLDLCENLDVAGSLYEIEMLFLELVENIKWFNSYNKNQNKLINLKYGK